MRFKDKVVLITGASRGIGRATSIEFAKEGATVVVNYNNSKEQAEETQRIIQGLGVKCMIKKADVSEEAEVKEMVLDIINTFGSIDILVNNAGVVMDLPFEERTVEHWKKTLGTNLIGTFICSKYVSDYMIKQKSGKIVNVASTNGIDTISPEAMDYDASKAGILILTRDLAKQLAPYVNVNAVAPGWVNTEMNKDLPKDFIEEETKKIYFNRFGEPEEIAKAILFLASKDASFITGSTLKVDGGYN